MVLALNTSRRHALSSGPSRQLPAASQDTRSVGAPTHDRTGSTVPRTKSAVVPPPAVDRPGRAGRGHDPTAVPAGAGTAASTSLGDGSRLVRGGRQMRPRRRARGRAPARARRCARRSGVDRLGRDLGDLGDLGDARRARYARARPRPPAAPPARPPWSTRPRTSRRGVVGVVRRRRHPPRRCRLLEVELQARRRAGSSWPLVPVPSPARRWTSWPRRGPRRRSGRGSARRGALRGRRLGAIRPPAAAAAVPGAAAGCRPPPLSACS